MYLENLPEQCHIPNFNIVRTHSTSCGRIDSVWLRLFTAMTSEECVYAMYDTVRTATILDYSPSEYI